MHQNKYSFKCYWASCCIDVIRKSSTCLVHKRVMSVLKTFHALSLHHSHQWAARTQPHVKRPDSPEKGDWSRFNPSAVLQTRRRSITLRDQNAKFTHSPPERDRGGKNVQRLLPGRFCTAQSSPARRTLCFVSGNQIMLSPSFCHVWVGTKQQQSTLVLFTVAKTNVNEHFLPQTTVRCVYRDNGRMWAHLCPCSEQSTFKWSLNTTKLIKLPSLLDICWYKRLAAVIFFQLHICRCIASANRVFVQKRQKYTSKKWVFLWLFAVQAFQLWLDFSIIQKTETC